MNSHKITPLLIIKIVVHLLFVVILALVTVSFIKKGGGASISDYMSGVGSVASIYGIIIALCQIVKAKNAAEAAEEAAKKKSKEINDFLSFATISRHIEISKSIPSSLSSKQYEAAIIKIEQLKELLVELREYWGLNVDERKTASLHISKLGIDISSIRKQMSGQNILEEGVVVDHIVNTNTFLQEISAKLKKINYDTREV